MRPSSSSAQPPDQPGSRSPSPAMEYPVNLYPNAAACLAAAPPRANGSGAFSAAAFGVADPFPDHSPHPPPSPHPFPPPRPARGATATLPTRRRPPACTASSRSPSAGSSSSPSPSSSSGSSARAPRPSTSPHSTSPASPTPKPTPPSPPPSTPRSSPQTPTPSSPSPTITRSPPSPSPHRHCSPLPHCTPSYRGRIIPPRSPFSSRLSMPTWGLMMRARSRVGAMARRRLMSGSRPRRCSPVGAGVRAAGW
jgi:hypothetical protein